MVVFCVAVVLVCWWEKAEAMRRALARMRDCPDAVNPWNNMQGVGMGEGMSLASVSASGKQMIVIGKRKGTTDGEP
jgi:hypothetical protein